MSRNRKGLEIRGCASRRGFARADLVAVAGLLVVGGACVFGMAGPPANGVFDPRPAKVLQCRDRLWMLADGMAMFAFDHGGAIAGPNTTGADGQAFLEQYYFDTDGTTPTSTHDWISPTMGEEWALPANRALRLQRILNDFACPEASAFNNSLFSSGNLPDAAQFQARLANGGFRQVSYLSPSAFHYYPNASVAAANPYHGVVLNYGQGSPVAVNPSYRPRLDLVGTQPLMKAYAADGVRYMAAGGVLDIDLTAVPSLNGNFLDPGPIVDGSTAYGRRSASSGQQLPLTFRHGGQINVVFFDGHVGRMSQQSAWTNASPWYPSGSVFNGVNATPESNAYYSTPASRILP